MFESNSKSVVTWVANLSSTRLVFRFSVRWCISHISRFDNEPTDMLTKMGLEGLNFKEFV